MSEADRKCELSADELVLALQICNNRKGERCSSCPAFTKFGYPRTCKRTVDLRVAELYKRLETERAALHAQEQSEPLTLCEYEVEELRLVAELMRKHEISPDDLKKCVGNFAHALKMVMEVQDAKLRDVLNAHEPKGAHQ